MSKAKATAKKASKKVVSKKAEKPDYAAILSGIKKGKEPETSGLHIRARLVEGKMSAQEIADEVRKKFKGSTAKAGDVYWNRGKLKREGVKLPA